MVFLGIATILSSFFQSCKGYDVYETVTDTISNYEGYDTYWKNRPEVVVFCLAEDLGDVVYTDRVLLGITKAVKQNDCIENLLTIKDDIEKEYNETIYNHLKSSKKKLLLFYGTFEDYVKKIDLSQKSDSVDIMVLESNSDIPGVTTVYCSLYGLGYLTGQMLDILIDTSPYSLHVIKANNFNASINEFCNGLYKLTSDLYESERFLGEHIKNIVLDPNGYSGYNLADYLYTEYIETHDTWVLPLCGNSSLGILRAFREGQHGWSEVVGMDLDMKPYGQVLFSSVKHIDLLAYDYVTYWVNGKIKPGKYVYTLSSEYLELIYGNEELDWDEEEFISYMADKIPTAIKKEQEYINSLQK